MFFIVNKTKQHITLGDIGITLGPRQAIDIDKVMTMEKSENSHALKAAKANGDIEIRVKDRRESAAIPNSAPLKDSNVLGDMKKEIIGEMRDVMKEFLSNQSGGISKEDLKELMESMPKVQETVIFRQDSGNIVKREDEEVEMDEETLSKINARTVNEIVKNTDSKSVHYEEKKIENTILNNVDELMGLL